MKKSKFKFEISPNMAQLKNRKNNKFRLYENYKIHIEPNIKGDQLKRSWS